jgi:alpha-1,6-mannosyltransferase
MLWSTSVKWSLVFFIVASGHVALCPFSKVEESFNMQAVHDLLHVGVRNVAQFDHVAHPGVVPRTFLGAVAMATAAWPFHWALQQFADDVFFTKLASQLVVRLVLAAMSAISLGALIGAVESAWGRRVAQCSGVLLAAQFHVLFYASRTLPNTFAAIFVALAFAALLRARPLVAVALLIVATAVFRCELALLAIPLILQLLITRHIGLWSLLRVALPVSLAAVAASVLVDSYFWRRWLYPEAELFHFNAVRGQSILWGASPWHWYASNALPRALAPTALLVPLGVALAPRRLLHLLFAPLAFVALYSFMPHKELRFVLNTVPLLTVAAGVALAAALDNAQRAARAAADPAKAAAAPRRRQQRLLHYAALALGVGVVAATLGTTAVFAYNASLNYAGGVAFARAHALLRVRAGERIVLHIDVAAAQTGVTRFGERRHWGAWTYSKDERRPLDTAPFTHLLGERSAVDGFRVLQATSGLAGFQLPTRANGWSHVVTRDLIYLLERDISANSTTGRLL